MKKFFLLLLLGVFSLSLPGEGLVPLNDWKVLYAGESSFENGVLKGTPQNSGSSMVKKISGSQILSGATRLRICGSGFEAADLSLSLRGKNRIAVRSAQKKEDGSFVFALPGLPENMREMRIYFNMKKRFTNKPVELKFTQIRFEKDGIYKPDHAIRRKRFFKETVIFPRIQSKYDLTKNYLSTYSARTGNFVDRPLFFNRDLQDVPLPLYDKQNTIKSFQKQLSVAKMFTSGLAIFYSERSVRYMRPIRAAEEAGLVNSVFMETPPTRLRNAAKFFPRIDETLKSPAVFKENGALIISSYHGSVYKPEQWKKLLAPYRKRYGNKVLFTVELRGLGYRMNTHFRKSGGKPSLEFTENAKKEIRSYLDVADGVNFSASNHLIDKKNGFPEHVLSIDAYRNYIIPVFVSVLAEEKYNGKKIFGLSAHKGYTQTRHTASNIDDEATRSMRSSFAAALESNCDYIIMPEWNEINENTHVEPLVSNALTNVRVMNAMRGKPVPDVETVFPNVILSFRQENDLAAPIPIEILGLPDAKGNSSKVVLHLYSMDGKKVRTFPAAEFSHKAVEEKFFMEKAGNFARHRCLIPELEIQWNGKNFKIREGLPHIRIAGAPNINATYVKIPLRDLPDPAKMQFTLAANGDNITAKGHAASLDDIMSVELLADENVLAAADPRNEYAVPEGMVMLRWMRMAPVVQGLSNDRIKMTAVKGRIRLRQPHIFSLTGMRLEQTAENVISGPIGAGCNIREFFFFATKDAVLEITSRGRTDRVTMQELLKEDHIRINCGFGIAQHIELCREQIEMPRPIGKKTYDVALSAPLRADKNTVYSLRVVTRQGRVFRSLPFMVSSRMKKTVQFPVWDLVTDRKAVLDVPQNLIRQVEFDFDPGKRDILPARSGIRAEEAMLGAFDYRTFSAKGWEALFSPVWRKVQDHYVLDFVKGSGIILCQPLFSKSAFDLELEASFAGTENQTLLDLVGNKMPVWLKNGKLSGSIETVKGRFNWQSALKLESNRFYRIRIIYDLEKLEVYVDDKPAASVPAAGNLSDGWILCIGGAPVKTAAAVSNVLAKTGQAHNQPNSGFNFSGTLKRLKISNCPLRSR